ncbi:MAG: hypothetical protein RJA39_842 [Pseudomonadota bacterium]|jgi:hypothetical protein
MSTVQMLMAQKMALERRIEQARQEEIDRQKRAEAERLASQHAEIASARLLMKSLMNKYGLTEDQFLRGQEDIFKIPKTQLNGVPGKKLSLQEMRMFYSKMQ